MVSLEVNLPRKGSWAVWFWIETNNQLRTVDCYHNCTHIFQASNCYRQCIDSNLGFLRQTECYVLAPETGFELTSQSQTGLLQLSQPSKQLASHGQSEMIPLKYSTEFVLTIQAFSIISGALTHTEGIIITIQNAFNRNDFASIFTSHIQIRYP